VCLSITQSNIYRRGWFSARADMPSLDACARPIGSRNVKQPADGGPPERSGSKLIVVRLVEQLSDFFGTARFFQESTERFIA